MQHLYNPWNEGKPVKIGRDGQEIQPRVGEELGRLFSEDKAVDLTPILRKSKEAARKHRVKVGGVKSGPLGGQHRVVRHGDRGRHHRGGRGRGGIESGRGRGDGGRGRRPRYEDQGKYSRYEDTRGSHGGGVGGGYDDFRTTYKYLLSVPGQIWRPVPRLPGLWRVPAVPGCGARPLPRPLPAPLPAPAPLLLRGPPRHLQPLRAQPLRLRGQEPELRQVRASGNRFIATDKHLFVKVG